MSGIHVQGKPIWRPDKNPKKKSSNPTRNHSIKFARKSKFPKKFTQKNESIRLGRNRFFREIKKSPKRSGHVKNYKKITRGRNWNYWKKSKIIRGEKKWIFDRNRKNWIFWKKWIFRKSSKLIRIWKTRKIDKIPLG